MKKILSLVVTLALVLSCIVGFAMNSVASEDVYNYADALVDYGKVDGITQSSLGAYNSAEGFFLADVWTYEFYDRVAGANTFRPMSSYYTGNPGNNAGGGWNNSGWVRTYVPDEGSPWSLTGGYSPYRYCMIFSNNSTASGTNPNGMRMHPAASGDPVLTFVAPKAGTISYDASLYAYGGTDSTATDGGTLITVWVNDEQVFPAAGSGVDNHIGGDDTSAADPFEIVLSGLTVAAGDRVRLCVTAPNGAYGGKGVELVDAPVVTYTEVSDSSDSNSSDVSSDSSSDTSDSSSDTSDSSSDTSDSSSDTSDSSSDTSDSSSDTSDSSSDTSDSSSDTSDSSSDTSDSSLDTSDSSSDTSDSSSDTSDSSSNASGSAGSSSSNKNPATSDLSMVPVVIVGLVAFAVATIVLLRKKQND